MLNLATIMLAGSLPFVALAPGDPGDSGSTASQATAVVQSLEGKYEVTEVNGDPIVPGATVVAEVKRYWWGYVVRLYVEENGQRQEVVDEAMRIVPTPGGLEGTNGRGNTASFTPKGGGEWEVEMCSGPNAGRRTKMTPI